jgi:hypothetical protein
MPTAPPQSARVGPVVSGWWTKVTWHRLGADRLPGPGGTGRRHTRPGDEYAEHPTGHHRPVDGHLPSDQRHPVGERLVNRPTCRGALGGRARRIRQRP